MENIMATIGVVTRQPEGGFKGRLATLTIRKALEIVPNTTKTDDRQPDFRVFGAGVEIGAGWTRKSRRTGEDYVSLSLAAPELGPKALFANLGPLAGSDDPDAFALIWNPTR
jgi:uncharacterized protein (DUF736 family)